VTTAARPDVTPFDECRDHSPELFATVSFLAMALEDAAYQLDQEQVTELLPPSLPSAVRRLIQRSRLVVSGDELCRILERAAAGQHFRRHAPR
jgi:hypothetical protein